ncbi:MAG: hypothetical protein JNN33_01985 [Rhodospirillaceae bacterium]|nr:hypothetical protein [Rhodospirillaceae bacterium]
MVQRTGLGAAELDAWNEAVLRMVNASSPAEIAEALVAALRRLFDFDTAFLALLRRDSAPIVPHYSGSGVEEPSPAYHEGPYLLDPFYNHFLAGGAEGCFRLGDLAPEGFLRSEYFSGYYRHLEIKDELGLLARIDADTSAHVSVLRHRNPARFTRRDTAWLAACAPLAREALRRMSERAASVDDAAGRPAGPLHQSLRAAYRNFGASVLTEREREVVHLLLQGNSAKAIARALAISPDTARNHLKRIYPKLEVSSQAELFALFFRALERVEPGFDGDPLSRLAEQR